MPDPIDNENKDRIPRVAWRIAVRRSARLGHSSCSVNRSAIWFLLTASTVALIASGCSDPDPKYQVKEDNEIVSVYSTDLGISKTQFDKMGGRLVSDGPSVGRFPAGLCVIRVDAFADEEDGHRFLRVTELPKHHAVYWNQLFDELSSIREVIFPGTSGLDPRGYDWQALLRDSDTLECGLCILYARLEATDADAEYAGVLWDTHARKPLAVFHIPVVLPAEFKEQLEKAEEDVGEEIIEREADFRAEQDFRRLVRDVVWDLAKQDQAPTTTQPSPWRKEDPILPRDKWRYWNSQHNDDDATTPESRHR